MIDDGWWAGMRVGKPASEDILYHFLHIYLIVVKARQKNLMTMPRPILSNKKNS